MTLHAVLLLAMGAIGVLFLGMLIFGHEPFLTPPKKFRTAFRVCIAALFAWPLILTLDEFGEIPTWVSVFAAIGLLAGFVSVLIMTRSKSS